MSPQKDPQHRIISLDVQRTSNSRKFGPLFKMIQVTDKDYETPAAVDSPRKSDRRVSTQAEKWANDERLALEFMKRQEEIVTWIEENLQINLPSRDLHEALHSGVHLLQMVRTPYATRDELHLISLL